MADFIDVVATCNIVIDRMEQTQDRIELEDHWLTECKGRKDNLALAGREPVGLVRRPR